MQHQQPEFDKDDEVLRRCRRVRDELNRRHKTADGVYAYLLKLEEEAAATRSGARSKRHVTPKRQPRVLRSPAASHAD